MSQEAAIQNTKGPCIVLAGAGTGKTFTIVEKIKHLIKEGYNPEKIVCLTFSNEAVNSLRRRILPVLTDDREPCVRTFHSFCADILKKKHDKNFKILTPDDAKIILHKNFKIQPYYCHQYISAIHSAKDLGITPHQLESWITENLPQEPLEELQATLQDISFKLQTQFIKVTTPEQRAEKKELQEKSNILDTAIKTKKLFQAWRGYEKLKEKRNMQDYADLNLNAIQELTKDPSLADYEYVIVDEFQDTNKLQLDLLTLLAPHKNITVVGDLNQSIYRFRGAYKENVPLFKKRFPNAQIFNLDKSYRSTNNILAIAHQLVENNYTNKEECFPVWSAFDTEGTKTHIFELEDNKEEVRKIVEIIKEELSKDTPPEEICVMFRTHQQSRQLKTELEFQNIPFTSVTKKSLLKIPNIKKVCNMLTIVNKIKTNSGGGDHAWWELINTLGFSKEDAVILSRAIKEARNDPALSKNLLTALPQLPITEQGKIRLHIVITQLQAILNHVEKPVPQLILDTYEIIGLNDPEKNDKENVTNLQRFHEVALEFTNTDSPDLGSFLHHIEIMNTLQIEIPAPQLDNSGIRIMTHHATKGLEYKVIIVANMAQKRFPLERVTSSIIPQELSPELQPLIQDKPSEEKKAIIKQYESENQLLEERRLCYVAFTRAKEKLFMTYAKEYGGKKALPSQFLNEINYKNNEKITFIQDKEQKYITPQPKIAPALTEHVPDIVFSPSSLRTFDECQKKYEYKYVYNMPDPTPTSWEAMKLGSFVHVVFEECVKKNTKSEKECIDIAKTFHMDEAWNFVELDEAIPLIKVFFHRNKHKYNTNSLTEKKLSTKLDDIPFTGIADRIDIKNNELEIIDYKTGSAAIPPKYRNWQLGFYALAATKYGTPKRVTLELLKKERPLEFEIDTKGNAKEINTGRMSFSLQEVKEELISTAKQIRACYKEGFRACDPEKNCEFCQEHIHS